MKTFKMNWKELERGQALMEYWPTIPVAITLLIFSGAMTGWLGGAFSRTAEGLNRAGLPEEICETTEEETAGPIVAELGTHEVAVKASHYDPETDTTEVVYHVTSGSQPSISHWVLALPPEVAANLLEASEQYEWTDSDPTTGVAGIKFDTGYEGGDAGGGGKKDKDDTDTTGDTGTTEDAGTTEEESAPGNSGGKGGKKDKARAFDLDEQYVSASFGMLSDVGYVPGIDTFAQTGEETTITTEKTGDARDIMLLFSGQYEFQETTVTIKAGTETEYATISAPMIAVVETVEEDVTNADTYHSGCE